MARPLHVLVSGSAQPAAATAVVPLAGLTGPVSPAARFPGGFGSGGLPGAGLPRAGLPAPAAQTASAWAAVARSLSIRTILSASASGLAASLPGTGAP